MMPPLARGIRICLLSGTLASCVVPLTPRPPAQPPPDPDGCQRSVADLVFTDREIDVQVKAVGRTVADGGTSSQAKVERIAAELPEVNRFERLDYRMCKASRRGDVTKADYYDTMRAAAGILPDGKPGEQIFIRKVEAVQVSEDRRDMKCQGRSPCSDDGEWFATLTEVSLATLQAHLEYRNLRVSCESGPACRNGRVVSQHIADDRRSAVGKFLSWSESVSVKLTAELWGPARGRAARR